MLLVSKKKLSKMFASYVTSHEFDLIGVSISPSRDKSSCRDVEHPT